MILSILSLCFFIRIGLNSLTQLISSEVHTQTLDTKSKLEFGFGSYFSYSPIPYYISKYGSDSQQSLFLTALIQKQTNKIKILHFCDIQVDTQTIIHKFKLETGEVFDYQVAQPKEYEGKWFFYYIKYSTATQIGTIQISDVSKTNNKIFTIPANRLIDQSEYIIQYTGIFKDGVTKYSYFPGLIYQIIQSSDFTVTESQILQDASSAKYTCYTDYDVQNLYLKLTDPPITQYLVDQACSDYAIESWIRLIKLPIYSQWEVEILQVAHNKFEEYFSHAGGNAFKLKYIYDSNKIHLNVQTYSYTFPTLMLTQTQINADTVQHTFENIQVDLLKWHFFKFNKISTNVQFQIYYPDNDLNLMYDFGKLYQFTRPSFSYYFGRNIQNQISYGLEVSNFTIYNKYTNKAFAVKCYSQCKTCLGPTSQHCKSCYDGTFRMLKDNKCVCQLGYVEQYSSSCYYPPSDSFIISPTKLVIKKEGYESTSPVVKCLFGYFLYNNECLKCPQPITEEFIGCYKCVTRQYTFFFYQGFSCKLSLFKSGFTFLQKEVDTIKYRYNMGELVVLVRATLCEMPYSKGFYGIHTIQEGEGQYCDSPLEDHQQDGLCYPTYPQIYQKYECGQFCESCDDQDNLRCYRCYNSEKYFISSDGFNCELCTIPNCKYCTLEDSENSDFQIYSIGFTRINRSKDSLQVICARCQDQYVFNYHTMSCEMATEIPNCELYYKDSNQQTQCILSTSLEISYTISKCQNYLAHCEICTISQYTLEAFCLQCEQYYTVIDSNICTQCPNNNYTCFKDDPNRQENWKSEIKPYFYNKHSVNDILQEKEYWIENIISEDTCDLIDLYQENCLQCKSDDYGIKRSTLDSYGQCKTCSYLCQACDDLSQEEILAINPQLLTNTISSTRVVKKCFQKASYENVYIDSNFRPLLCEDSTPCKIMGIKEVIYTSCIRLMMALSFRSLSSFDSSINKETLMERGISIFKYDWSLISPSKCTLVADITSTIQTYTPTLEEIQFVFKGAVGTKNNQITTSFSIKQMTYVCLQDLTFLDHSSQFLAIYHYTIYTDINFINNIFLNWTYNQPIKTQNMRNLNLINNTFLNFKFSGQQIFTVTQDYHLIESITVEGVTFQNCELSDSYFLNLQASQVSSQFKLKLNNIIIKDCIIRNFVFFNLMIDQADIQITNLVFENITAYNSSFLNGTFTNLTILENFTLSSSKIKQSSVIIRSNYIQLVNIKITNNIFDESSLLKMTNVSSPNLTFDQMQFQSNAIEGTQPIMELYNFNNNIKILNMLVEDFKCINQQFNFYPLFLFQANQIIIDNVDIFQPKNNQKLLFSIYNTNYLQILNIKIQNIESIDKVIKTTYECFEEDDTQGIFHLVDNSIITVSSIQITNFQAINNGLFTMIFSDKYKLEIQEIKLTDISITDTILIKSKENIQLSLFYIGTAQQLTLAFTNSNFTNVWMHHYYTDNAICSTLLTAIAPYSQINLNNLKLKNILATNTSDSIMQFDVKSINISNIMASNINNFNFMDLKRFLTFNIQLTSQVYMEDIHQLFQIKSQGGLANFQSEYINCNNLYISQIKSQSGGLFYIKTKSNGIVILQNSKFTNIQGNLLSQISKGGLLYIDSLASLLSLTLINIITSETLSWQQGGLIFIIPSAEETNIFISNTIISNSFSTQGSILYAEFEYRSTALITINNLTIYDQSIEYFMKKLQVQNDQNIKELIQNNYLFDTQYCTEFTIVHSQFSNIKYFNILNLQNTASLKIYDVSFQQMYFTNSSFIQLLNSQITSSFVLMDRLTIQNSLTFNYNLSQYSVRGIDCISYIPKDFSQSCLEDNSLPLDLIYYLDIYISDIVKCNMQKMIEMISSSISNTQDQSTLFKISSLESKINFRGTNLYANNISLSNQGFLIIILNDNLENQVKLFDSTVENSDCGQYGCLNIINSFSDNLTNLITNITQVKGTISQSRLRRLSESFNFVNLYNFDFISNKAKYGSGILSINNNVNMTNCQFLNNIAEYAGGAIYIQQQESNKLKINNLYLSNNSAEQGSDIFIKGNTDQIDLSSVQGISLDSNKSVSSKPVALTVKAVNGIILNRISILKGEVIRDQVYINPYKIYGSDKTNYHLKYPSGQQISQYTYFDPQTQTYIPYNLRLQILAFNDKQEQVINLDGSSCNLYYKQSNDESDFQPLLNQETVYYDTETKSYNLDNYTFIFDPVIQNDLHLIIKVKCDSILYDNYELLFTVQTFKCQMGEYYFQSQCLVCDPEQSYYSLDPSKGKCDIKNDQTTLNIKSAMVQLKENYWRPKVQSSQIVYCLNNPNNCLGGWNVGDLSCKPGYIGALCEECDLWNLNGYGRFGKTVDYNCDVCQDFQYIYLKTFFLVLWIYFSVFITCQSVNNSNVNIKKQSNLNPEFYKLLHSFSVDKTSIVLKMLTNFVQIVSAIQSFHISLNLNLDFAFGIVGNPVKQITTLLDCHLSLYADDDIIYYRLIFMACLVIFLIQFGLIMYLLIIYMKKATYNSSNVWVLMIFIYLFTQSGLVFDISSALGYREIANNKWIKGAVYLQYDTFNHFLWILRVVVPITGFFQLVIPGMLFFELYHNRRRLFDFSFRKRFSYLVNEYKESVWFWEIIKLFQRTYIIANLNLYADEMMIKSTQIFLAILIYMIFLQLFQPYSQRPLIELEVKSTIVQLSSIVLAATIYQAQLSENSIYYLYALILILIVAGQILIFVFEISKGYFEKLRLMIENIIHQKLEQGSIRLPTYIEQYFKKKQSKKALLNMRFKKLRGYLRSQTKVITEVKSRQNQSGYPMRAQKSDYNFTDILLSPKSEKQEQIQLNNQFQS